MTKCKCLLCEFNQTFVKKKVINMKKKNVVLHISQYQFNCSCQVPSVEWFMLHYLACDCSSI